MKKSSPNTLLLGIWNGLSIAEKAWQFLKELKIKFSCDPAILFIKYIPKKTENIST